MNRFSKYIIPHISRKMCLVAMSSALLSTHLFGYESTSNQITKSYLPTGGSMAVSRKDVPTEDRWNVEALYPHVQAWEQDLSTLVQSTSSPYFPELLAFKGRIKDSPHILKQALDTFFATDRHLRKLFTWAHLRHDEDIADDTFKKAYERILSYYHIFGQEISWFEPEILSMDTAIFEARLQDPLLKDYHFFLEKLYRLKPHTLSESEERLLALAEQPLSSVHKTFSAINDADFKFGKVLNSKGEECELTHATYGLYIRSQDRTLRENAFKALHKKFMEFENTMASLLQGEVQKHCFVAKARNYANALEAALYPKNIEPATYYALIEAVHTKIEDLHKYMRLRKKLMGVDELHLWDVYVPLVPSHEMRFSYTDAEKTVLESIKPLGKQYQIDMSKGLKDDRWVDRFENTNKRSGAYSSGCFDSMPYILMNFRGLLNDTRTLAHEAGHSMHSLYSRRHQPYHYADYAIFVAEVASTFNEQLLMKTLLEKTQSKEEKAFLINEKIEDIRATLFRQTMFAEFELFIHDCQEKHIPLTPQLLKEEYIRLNRFYFGPDVVIDPEIAIEWARIPHFYYNFYVFQYATGISASLALSEQVLHGHDEERERYLTFLKSGSSDYPVEILKKAGVDMTSRKPVEDAIQTFSNYVSQLESLLTE